MDNSNHWQYIKHNDDLKIYILVLAIFTPPWLQTYSYVRQGINVDRIQKYECGLRLFVFGVVVKGQEFISLTHQIIHIIHQNYFDFDDEWLSYFFRTLSYF